MKSGVWAIAVSALLLASCATLPKQADNQVEAAMGALVIRPDGIGPWKVGVSYAEISKTAPLELQYSSETTGSADEKPTGRGCEYFVMAENWPGLGFMFEEDVLTRIDLFDPNGSEELPDPIDAVTENGVKIGESKAKVVTAYGASMEVTPHPYLDDEGSYLSVMPAGSSPHGIIFETFGETITSLRVGDRNSVQYIEGCL